ncbi:MAG: two-component system sensor histidine kinase NtrB [Myxococcales bacterium]
MTAAEILEEIEALVLVCRADGTVEYVNRHLEAAAGRSRQSLVGSSWIESLVPREHRDGAAALLGRAVTSRRPVAEELPLVDAAGLHHTIRWALRPADTGVPLRLVAVGTDVTDLAETGKKARLAERLCAIGTLSAGLAHEIRNPLNAALLQLEVLARLVKRSGAPEAEAMTGRLDLASQELRRLAQLLCEFLAFAQPDDPQLETADLRPLLSAQARGLESSLAARGIRVAVSVPEGPLLASHDSAHLRGAVECLLRNAAEAVPDGATIELIGRPEGEGAAIDVRDTGPGIPRALLGRIFDPFFTTKEDGTGLGLAIVHSTVQQHGGSIRVKSEPSRGTTFSIWLPRSPPTDGPIASRGPAPRAAG